MRPITAASRVIRPRAEPRVPVVPASIPIAMPMPSSSPVPSRKLTSKTYTPGMEETPHRRRAHTRPAIWSATPASSPRAPG